MYVKQQNNQKEWMSNLCMLYTVPPCRSVIQYNKENGGYSYSTKAKRAANDKWDSANMTKLRVQDPEGQGRRIQGRLQAGRNNANAVFGLPLRIL